MKSFREILQDSLIGEGLIYTVPLERIEKFKNIEDYDTETKGTKTLYYKDGEVVFTYDIKSKKINVIKQGWQLMNLDRGF
jgi:gamma-glutamylcyclotransferase (GGCT)/AIG2-like uncharacterized protein YtfP